MPKSPNPGQSYEAWIGKLEARSVSRELDYETACQCWTGNRIYGYGHLGIPVATGKPFRTVRIHRHVWEHHHGPIPDGMHVDHLCCDPAWCDGGPECPHRACWRIEHLALRTPRENVLRGNGPAAANSRKTHCIRNHPLDGDNLVIHARGYRACRACKNERQRVRRRESSHA